MSHKTAFEALDKTLQDIRGNKCLMGGVTFTMAGDFRQTLPLFLEEHELTRCKHVSNPPIYGVILPSSASILT